MLAAGSSAQTSGPITPIVPHMQVTGLDKAAAAQQLRQNKLTQELIEAQKYAALAQGDKATADASIASNDAKWRDIINQAQYVNTVRQAELIKNNINKIMAEINNQNLNTAEQLYNWRLAQRMGVRSDIKSGSAVNVLTGAQSIINSIKGLAPEAKELFGKLIPSVKKSTEAPRSVKDYTLGGVK